MTEKQKKLKELEKLAKDGFFLSDDDDPTVLALYSLKIALKAYFSTYRSMKSRLFLFDKDTQEKQECIDKKHSVSYCEACTEAILHFQHFAELVCKDFLRKDHPLLANRGSNDPVIFHKLLKNEPIATEEWQKINSLEARETLERLCKLIKAKRIGKDGRLDFIHQAKDELEQLNQLRNRMWHRGRFILRYPALDKFVGKYILPFVAQVTGLEEYSNHQSIWKYKKLRCGVDPFEGIIDEFHSQKFDLRQIPFLKELGRAAYENPKQVVNEKAPPLLRLIAQQKNDEHRRRLSAVACSEEFKSNVEEIRECPVCGENALLVYHDYDNPHDSDKKVVRYTYAVECVCCTFSADKELENPSTYGFPIQDFWMGVQL